MTRKEAVNKLKSLKEYYNDKNEDSYVGFDNEDNEALDLAIKALEQTSWIPVSERLPVLTGKYLVTVKNGNVYAAVFDSWSGRFQCAATAWMPLPEPYKAESEDNKCHLKKSTI